MGYGVVVLRLCMGQKDIILVVGRASILPENLNFKIENNTTKCGK